LLDAYNIYCGYNVATTKGVIFMEPKDVFIKIRADKQFADEVKRTAKEQGLTLSAYLRTLHIKELKNVK